jgi:hypothetical protein
MGLLLSIIHSIHIARMSHRQASTTDIPEETQEKIRSFRQKHFTE